MRGSNAASQVLDPSRRTVVNRAEYLGDKLWVTASGTYEPLVSVGLCVTSVVAAAQIV